METKYCKFCGEQIPADAIVCTHCGRQVEELKRSEHEPIVINNNNNVVANANATATATAVASVQGVGRPKNKWIALLLCLFTMCGHKFYEGKVGMGLLYFFSLGLFGIGWVFDIFSLLFKPNPYYV